MAVAELTLDIHVVECDILIVGASAGGTAAALAAADAGAMVCLLEETDWLGGQLTVQGVCTPDENRHIETFGCTRRYQAFRNATRDYYKSEYSLSQAGLAQNWFNPGSCWVSGLSFEPRVGARILAEMLETHVTSGKIHVYYRTRATGITMASDGPDRIDEVIASHTDGAVLRFRAKFVLDATDTGELLPLCGEEGADWVIGAESRAETGEPDAQETARPDWVQPLTFPFPVDWSPTTCGTNVIEPPGDYAELRTLQKYHIKHGAITGLFAGAAPWWTYRRVLASANFDDPRIPADLAMINTAGNDYYGGNILGSEAGSPEDQAATLVRARRAALGYLYWLQTECPREGEGETGTGYPEFRLRRDIFGTEDGCSIKPYIRESRRIKSLRTILQQEIVVRDFSGSDCRGDNARAAFMPDTVGIGHYALDIHPNGHGEPNHFVPTRPFQIPLGALVPGRIENLLPACKNLGTTHLTNGAYRLHPIEWNIGESAGLLAVFCLKNGCLPCDVNRDRSVLRNLQVELLQQGIPLHWYIDVPASHPSFIAVQRIAGLGVPIGAETDLLFRPDDPITKQDWANWRHAIHEKLSLENPNSPTTKARSASPPELGGRGAKARTEDTSAVSDSAPKQLSCTRAEAIQQLHDLLDATKVPGGPGLRNA